MISFEAPISYLVDELEDGRARIDLPRSPLDGYVAQTRGEAMDMIQREAARLVEELLAQPDVHQRLLVLERETGRCAPNLTLRVDVRDMIVFFPGDEMLAVGLTITMLRAYADMSERHDLVELDDETYAPVLAHAQEQVRLITAEQID